MAAPSYLYGPNEGLRNLLLGRVLLKANASAGTYKVRVGSEFEPPYDSCCCPGTMQWWSTGQRAATIVQPGASDLASSIEHSEDVTVYGLAFADMHCNVSPVLTKAYTTARGAYLRLEDVPDITADVKFIQPDFIESWMMPDGTPEDRWFPAILVMSQRGVRRPLTNVMWQDQYAIVVRYYRLIDDTYTHDVMKDAADEISEIISRDNYLGGTVSQSHVEYVDYNPTPGRNRTGGGVLAKSGLLLDWVDIYVSAFRYIAYLAHLSV